MFLSTSISPGVQLQTTLFVCVALGATPERKTVLPVSPELLTLPEPSESHPEEIPALGGCEEIPAIGGSLARFRSRSPRQLPRCAQQTVLANVWATSAVRGHAFVKFKLDTETPLGKLVAKWCEVQDIPFKEVIFVTIGHDGKDLRIRET